MALEEVGYVGKNAAKLIKLAENITAATAAPSTAADGIAVYPKDQVFTSDSGHCYSSSPAQWSTLLVDMAGTTPSFTFKLWGYLAKTDKWYEIKTFAAMTANKAELVQELGHYNRLYLQATAVSGTTPSANAWLVTSRTVSY
jgi:hypothetical protein